MAGKPEVAGVAMVGSLVTDLTFWLPHFHGRGEKLHPTRIEMFAGGKGFNQAPTARQLGAQVGMIGRVGNDAFADRFLEILRREGIDAEHVRRDPEPGTSLGIPMITPTGRTASLGSHWRTPASRRPISTQGGR